MWNVPTILFNWNLFKCQKIMHLVFGQEYSRMINVVVFNVAGIFFLALLILSSLDLTFEAANSFPS